MEIRLLADGNAGSAQSRVGGECSRRRSCQAHGRALAVSEMWQLGNRIGSSPRRSAGSTSSRWSSPSALPPPPPDSFGTKLPPSEKGCSASELTWGRCACAINFSPGTDAMSTIAHGRHPIRSAKSLSERGVGDLAAVGNGSAVLGLSCTNEWRGAKQLRRSMRPRPSCPHPPPMRETADLHHWSCLSPRVSDPCASFLAHDHSSIPSLDRQNALKQSIRVEIVADGVTAWGYRRRRDGPAS